MSGINCTNINAVPTALEQSLQTSVLPIFSTYGAGTNASERLYIGRKGQKAYIKAPSGRNVILCPINSEIQSCPFILTGQ